MASRSTSLRLGELSTRYGELLAEVEKEIYSLAGHPLNIGSPKQLQQVLFDEQKLPMLKRTKTGGSTDVEVLEELARQHPLPAKIIEYRQYAKLKSTYIDALPRNDVRRGTGRVHASFNQVVAATGRLSSSDPNLQNIPVRSESGREIRAAFLPGPRGLEIAGGRLFADRAARAGPLFAGRDVAVRHSPATRISMRWWLARFTACRWPGDGRDAAGGEGGEFWRNLRAKSVRPGEATRHRAGRGGPVHQRLFRSLSGGRAIPAGNTGRVSAQRLC